MIHSTRIAQMLLEGFITQYKTWNEYMNEMVPLHFDCRGNVQADDFDLFLDTFPKILDEHMHTPLNHVSYLPSSVFLPGCQC